MDAEGKKKKVSKWTCKVCEFENLQKATVCKKCKSDKGATADGHQSDESSHHAANKSQSPNSGGIQKKEIHPSLSILADVKVIISRFENEIQQYEEAKSSIKSKKHLKQITEDKQQIIQTLDEVSRLLSKQTSDELISTRNQKSQDTILKQKRKRLTAERESQWVAREENLNEEFKVKRQQELTEIENQWSEKWKLEMDEKWSTIELYIKEDLPEKDLDTRKKQFIEKFTSEWKLKFEGMKILWESRNNIEWTGRRLISKLQWDNESGQLWTVEKQNFNAKLADEVASNADTGTNTVPKQINEMLEICKSQLENIFKSSKALAKITEKTQETIEKHMSNDVEECKKLHNMMAAVSTAMQQQEEDLKSLMSEKNELKNTFIEAKEQMEETKQMMSEENKKNKEELKQKLAESEQARENLTRKNIDLALKLKVAKAAIDEQETNRKKSLEEQQCQMRAESKLKYETDSKEWQDRCEALMTSECQLNRLAEQLKKKSKRKDKIGSTTNITGRDGRNKQPIENYHEGNATNTWYCENCTLDNPHNIYICDTCGKLNDKQRDKIILEVDEVKDQRHPPITLSEELLNRFETAPKNKRSESDSDSELYSEGEDPFEFLDNSGRKNDSDAGLTGGQFRREFQNKQSHGRLGKTSYGVDSDKRSNKIKHNKTANHWTCKHCTLDNSLDQYICASCCKTNDHLRTTMGNKIGAVQKQKRRNLESNEDENIDRELKNVNQNATAIDWSCEHCTTANPLDQYICDGCSKTNAQQRQNIVQEKEAVQKHYLQPTTPHKNYATKLRVTNDRLNYHRYKDAGNLGRHGNSHALVAREQIEDDNAAAAGIDQHNIDQLYKPSQLFTKVINYISGKGIETEVQRVLQLSQIPWDHQNDTIKKNYRNIVSNGRMTNKSQWMEMAAILQFIYPEIDIDIIIDSILRYDDIEKAINTILKHQKK